MKRVKIVFALAVALSLVAATPAFADVPRSVWDRSQKTDLCERDSVARVMGQGHSYLVNNNNFAGTAECLTLWHTQARFVVSESHATSTGPESDAFPNIFTGCSWGICSPHSQLPARVSRLHNPVTTFDTNEKAPGWWAAAYDIWFNPRLIRTGQADTEMMIWLNAKGLYNPAGKGWPIVRIDGALWYVLTWITGNGRQTWRYVQFRKYTPRWSENNMPLAPFFKYMENSGWIRPSWYLLNIEAGFEIWNGGRGLTVQSFSARV
jgi:Glycosyl hydrolase family 12